MPHIFPIGGGKGGSCKSFITANPGALVARQGQRVVLVDLDLARAAVPTCIPNLFVITSMDFSILH